MKVLLDFLFDGPATSGTATTGRPRQQQTTCLPSCLSADRTGRTHHDELHAWKQQVDDWLAPLKTDAAYTEQHAFLRRLLRQDPTDALDTVAVTGSALYSAFLEGAHAGDSTFFVERIVATNTPEEIARNRSLIAQLARMYGEEKARQVLPLLAATLEAQEQQRLATPLGTDVATGQEVSIPLDARFQGVYCIGATGTGKTTTLLHMILSDIYQGRGICLVEPHGDLTRQVIAGLPESRLNDVVYLDLMDNQTAYSLNFFEVEPGADTTQIAKVASFVMHLFETVWAAQTETTPRLAMVLRNVTRVLIENPGMTFAEIGLLLWEDGVREKLVRRVTNTQTKLFWSQYNRKQPREREELIASTINKVDAYLNEPLIARIVSQSTSTIDFRRIMDEGKILLVQLSPQLEEPSRLIGAAILGRLLLAAFSRSDTPQAKRRPFMIYADEYQRFATTDFATFLAEARKSGVATTIAHQTLEQVDDLNRATALQAGTVIVLRVSGEDSKALAPSFDATPQLALVGEEPIRAPVADPLGHLVRHGHPNPTVAKFVSDYLMRLDALIKSAGSSPRAFGFGCAIVLPDLVMEGHRQLNACLARCMREGTAAIGIPGLALFVLGGASHTESTYVFYHNRIIHMGYLPLVGLSERANTVGRADFLASETRALAYLRQCARTSMFEWRATIEGRVTAFLRMLSVLRETMAILATEPLLTDTGLFQPKYQLRTYQDQENLVANELSQLSNYTAKVRILTKEHTIKSRPAPAMLPERELTARIRAIKERMLREGTTTSASAVDEMVRKRHETLRQRPPDVPPPNPATGRRPRVKPPGRP